MAETVIGYGDDKFVLGGIVVIKCALAQLCFGCNIAKAGAVDALCVKREDAVYSIASRTDGKSPCLRGICVPPSGKPKYRPFD